MQVGHDSKVATIYGASISRMHLFVKINHFGNPSIKRLPCLCAPCSTHMHIYYMWNGIRACVRPLTCLYFHKLFSLVQFLRFHLGSLFSSVFSSLSISFSSSNILLLIYDMMVQCQLSLVHTFGFIILSLESATAERCDGFYFITSTGWCSTPLHHFLTLNLEIFPNYRHRLHFWSLIVNRSGIGFWVFKLFAFETKQELEHFF